MTAPRHSPGTATAVLTLLAASIVWLASAQDPPPETGEASIPPISESRIWTDASGRTLDGRLLAYDRVRATMKLADERVVFVKPASLVAADQQYLADWRKGHPHAAWIDPDHLPPWPVKAGSGPVNVVAVKADALATRFVYHSANFEIISDVSLPLDTVAEMATSFEATRIALLTLPLGLGATPKLPRRTGFRIGYASAAQASTGNAGTTASAAAPRSHRLRVELFITPQAYGLAGGPGGSGGFYSAWRRSMLISLQNFGIGANKGRVTLDYRNNLFILRHEVTHLVMHAWLPITPVWLHEGMAEYMAALPYQNGRYEFRDPEMAFLSYLNKWRFEEDQRVIPMRPPAEMLSMTGQQWQASLSMNTPVLNYNSAALLSWFFLRQDGEGKAAHLAAFFDAAAQEPLKARELATLHLLRQRTPEQIAAEIRTAWKKHGVTITIE